MKNIIRKGCIDEWGSMYCNNAKFTHLDMPKSPTTAKELPSRIITWKEAQNTKDYSAWVSFYSEIETYDGDNSIWKNPTSTLKLLKKFKGVITPSFCGMTYNNSIYEYDIFRSRAFSYWLGTNDIAVINSISWNEEAASSTSFSGLPSRSVLSLSNKYYNRENIRERLDFENELSELITMKNPTTLVIYGKDDPYFLQLRKNGIKVIIYDGNSGLQIDPTYCPSNEKPIIYPDFKADIIPGYGVGNFQLGMKSEYLKSLINYRYAKFEDRYNAYTITLENKLRLFISKETECLLSIGILPRYEGKLRGLDVMRMNRMDLMSSYPYKFEFDDWEEVDLCREDLISIEYSIEGEPQYLALFKEDFE